MVICSKPQGCRHRFLEFFQVRPFQGPDSNYIRNHQQKRRHSEFSFTITHHQEHVARPTTFFVERPWSSTQWTRSLKAVTKQIRWVNVYQELKVSYSELSEWSQWASLIQALQSISHSQGRKKRKLECWITKTNTKSLLNFWFSASNPQFFL